MMFLEWCLVNSKLSINVSSFIDWFNTYWLGIYVWSSVVGAKDGAINNKAENPT